MSLRQVQRGMLPQLGTALSKVAADVLFAYASIPMTSKGDSVRGSARASSSVLPGRFMSVSGRQLCPRHAFWTLVACRDLPGIHVQGHKGRCADPVHGCFLSSPPLLLFSSLRSAHELRLLRSFHVRHLNKATHKMTDPRPSL